MLPVRTERKVFTSQKAPSSPSGRDPWAREGLKLTEAQKPERRLSEEQQRKEAREEAMWDSGNIAQALLRLHQGAGEESALR